MNIIRMSGGLERQMFQYALYLKLTSLGREVKFDDINEYQDDRSRPIMLSVFNLDYPRATWDEINMYTDGSTLIKDRIRKLFTGRKTNIYKEQGFYDSKVLDFEDKYLYGKFMSQKYFGDIIGEVRSAFTFPVIEDISTSVKIKNKFVSHYEDIVSCNAVGIHIRRSDSRFNEEMYQNICTTEYYRAAVRYIAERVPDAKFFVFSNESKWIKKWVKDIIRGFITDDMSDDEIKGLLDRYIIIETNDEFTSYLDMYLLSSCKHNILSNSSFSWWGGWLNKNENKILIAPSIWVNGEDSKDIFTEGMIQINPKGKVIGKVK